MELESLGEHSEAVSLLRNQHVRMRDMVGSDAVTEPLLEPAATRESTPSREENVWPANSKQVFTPYTDDPEAGRDPVLLLQEQRRLMDGACRACCCVRNVSLQRTCKLQARTYIWIRFHAQLPVSVTYRCKSMTSSKYIQAC